MRKLYQFTLYAVAATIIAIIAGYAVLGSDWSSFSGAAITCDRTPSPSECICPEDEVKVYGDGLFDCKVPIDIDNLPKENPTDKAESAPEDPVFQMQK